MEEENHENSCFCRVISLWGFTQDVLVPRMEWQEVAEEFQRWMVASLKMVPGTDIWSRNLIMLIAF